MAHRVKRLSFQRTWVWCSASPWWLSKVYNSRSSAAFRHLQVPAAHMIHRHTSRETLIYL